MNLSILEEPELEFGGGSRHIDIRFGIKDYGPFDLQAPKAPKEVRLGLRNHVARKSASKCLVMMQMRFSQSV